MIYKFYKAQVTGAGYMPQGDCLATLHLGENREPNWSGMSAEFQSLCLPWFTNTVRMGILDNPEPFVPYSEEALAHLEKHQLPSQGFVMVKISSGPKPKPEEASSKPTKAKAPITFPSVGFSPPPHLFKKKP